MGPVCRFGRGESQTTVFKGDKPRPRKAGLRQSGSVERGERPAG